MINRHDGRCNFIRTLLRPLQRNGGRVWFSRLPVLLGPKARTVRLGAGRAIHNERHAFNERSDRKKFQLVFI